MYNTDFLLLFFLINLITLLPCEKLIQYNKYKCLTKRMEGKKDRKQNKTKNINVEKWEGRAYVQC